MRPSPIDSPRAAATLLALALCLTGCSEEPVPHILHPDLAGARILGTQSEPGPDLLGSASEPWRPARWIGWNIDLETAPTGASRDGSRLSLGPESSAWLRWLEVEGDASYELSAWIEGSDLGTAGSLARLGAIELSGPPTAATWPDLAAAMTAGHFSDPRTADERVRDVLFLHTAEATRYLVVFGMLTNDKAEPGVRARFEDLRLGAGTIEGRIADLLGPEHAEPAGRGPAPFLVAMTEREASVVAARETLVLDLDLPEGGGRLELAVALVPRARDPRAPALGTPLTLTVNLLQGDRELDFERRNTALAVPEDELWHELVADLPADLVPGPAELHVRTASTQLPLDAPLGLVASPRIVPPAPHRPGPNVVVVSIDTLRADRMSLYGHERRTTPRLDAFAKDALVFDAAWANGAYTLPSHMSLFTGQVPSFHGVQGAGVRRDPARSPLLAEVLSERGWTTAAFTGGGFVSPDFGFAAGFERYGTLDPMVNTDSKKLAADLDAVPGVDLDLLRRSDMRVVETWLEQHANESFFLFLHTYAVHQFDPAQRHLDALGLEGLLPDDKRSLELIYTAGEGGSEAEFERVRDLYDATVLQADEGFGRLVDKLVELDLLEDTIVIVTSDHGKEIGEHGTLGHGHALFEEMVHVPLIVRLPGRAAGLERGAFAPGRSSAPASLVDIVPTLLEALDIAPWPGMQGTSLLSLDPTTRRPILAEVDNLAVKFARRDGDLKTIWSPLDRASYIPNDVEELSFDLAADPLELEPLAPDPARVDAVRETFESLRAWAATLGSTVEATLDDPGLRARLEALGYVDDMRALDD
ncbi:MAG: sulfatase [Planctomycetota bacterium]|nr:sulfatase [Planctomycetota bacterium]